MSVLHRTDPPQRTQAFRSAHDRHRYFAVLAVLVILAGVFALGLLVYNNPVPMTSPSFLPVVKRRMNALIAMAIAAVCQSLATVAFQSITNNRVITPSLLGFESLYSAINTSTIFFFGATSFIQFKGMTSFVVQMMAMIVLCLLLFGWLLSGRYANMQVLLLVGVIIGTGLKSVSSFMRRLLAPSEFDILQARLFGSVNNADSSYFILAVPIVIIAAILLLRHAKRLNVLALGKDVSTSLGSNHQRDVIYTLILVSVLMSVSTALVGPLTFYGFLIATMTYQAVSTYDHRYLFPMAAVIGFLVITAAYFLMYHVFSAQGVVTIVIELFGGLAFLFVILRKGTL